MSEKRRVGKKIKVKRSKRTLKLRRKLKTGTYILINNKRGNYKKKRYDVLKVTTPPSAGEGSGSSAGTSTTEQTPPAASEEALPPGEEAFLVSGCGGCHTLADIGAMGTSATSLDKGKPSYDTVADVVTNGITHEYRNQLVPAWKVMPAYNTKLTAQEIEDLSNYVSTVTGGGDGSAQLPGRQNLLRMGCGSCHSLTDTGAVSTISNDFDVTKPSTINYGMFEHPVAEGTCEFDLDDPLCVVGITNHMPAYETKLSGQEIKDIGDYLDVATGEGQSYGSGCDNCHDFD